MIRRFIQLLVAFLIVLLAVYVVVTNGQTVTVQLSDWSLSAALGVIVLLAFAAGVLLTALVALVFGLAAFLRERKLERREKERLAFYDGMLEARNYTASEDWDRALLAWQKIIRKDPTHVIARVELARAMQGQGELREALSTIDAARGLAPQNVEVLFRAAEFNLALNNKTAAIDNLALILYHQPNRRAARMARDLSEELGRIEDAFEYQTKLESFGLEEESTQSTRTRLEFKKLLRDASQAENAKVLLASELQAFLKKNPDFLPAYEKLAEIEQAAGHTEAATQAFLKAAKLSGDPVYWQKLSNVWLQSKNADKAISSARVAVREARGAARITAELELARLYCAVGMYDEAVTCLSELEALAQSETTSLSPTQRTQQQLIRGLCHAKRGELREAQIAWEAVATAA